MAKEDIEIQEDLVVEENHAEPRVYELGFHLDSEIPQEEAKKAYQALKEVIAGQGTIIAEGEPEKIQLAYTISRMETTGRRDFSSAYFGWVAYETAGEGHATILNAAKAEKRIIRFLDLRTSKEAAKHSAEMHEFYRQTPEAVTPGDEDVSEVELDAALKEAGVS